MKSRVFSKYRILFILAITIPIFLSVGGYFSGLRLTVWTPSNYRGCSNTLDHPAGTSASPKTQQEKEIYDKLCPSVFWGEITVTRPSQNDGVEQLFSWQFYRPYWGYVWPDNNLGKFAPVQRPEY